MMIITPDDKRPSDAEGPFVSEEPPPSYSPHPDSVASASDPASPSLNTFKTKPTNFLALSNDHDSVRGEFVIDPSISIPSALLPPLADGESEADRKNLSLASKNSSVKARIWLLGPRREAGSKPPRRTTIVLASTHGSVHATLQTLDGAAPFSLIASAHHGGVKLAIPQSFQGLVSLSTQHGSVSLDDALIRNGTQLSQVGNTQRYFIGDFQLLGEEEWQGDQMEISSVHGSIRLKYVDDDQEVEQGKRGLFSRLFGK